MTSVVVFAVGDEHYGIAVEAVREVLIPPAITRLPGAPDFLQGIIRLRGHVIPIVDLRARFGTPMGEGPNVRVIVVAMEKEMVGLIVDSVLEVRRLPIGSIRALPSEAQYLGQQFLVGVAPEGKENQRLLLILDPDRILNPDERRAIGKRSIGED